MAELEYLTTHEVAQHYRTADATIRYWRHIGYGPRGTKIGRRVLYPRVEIERFDQERRKATHSGAEARPGRLARA